LVTFTIKKSKLESNDLARQEKKDRLPRFWNIPIVFALLFINSCPKERNHLGLESGKGELCF
jgi:hypothetical protein